MHSTSFNNHLLSTPPSSLHPLHHDPSSVLASTIQQLHPKEYLRRFLEKSIRPDARGVLEFRALAITQDGITTAEGSALVKLGQTTLLCVIKAEVAIPDLLAPQLGYLVPNIELTPLCSNQFKPGPPSPLAQSLSRFIADVHAKTPIIDLEQLCIDPGNAVWTLYADMYCLSYHGNILDAAWIALISALHSVRLPKAIYEDGCVRASKDKSLGTPLRFLHLPFTCTFATFDDYILADPNADETSLASGSFSITLNANDMNGPILGLHHTGGLPFTLNMLTTSLQVTRQRIQTILKTVLPSTSEIDGD